MRPIICFAAVAALFLTILSPDAGAQETKRVSVTGNKIQTSDFYLFPEFTDGTVLLNTGRVVQAKLNYNAYEQCVQFLGDKGEVLNIDMPDNVISVTIADRTFYYINRQYMELVKDGNISLMVVSRAKVDNVLKEGPYGTKSSTQSSSSLLNYNDSSGQTRTLNSSDEVIYAIDNTYFIGGGKRFVLATRKNFTKLLPKNKDQINSFIDREKIAFDKTDDLLRLVEYCNSLE